MTTTRPPCVAIIAPSSQAPDPSVLARAEQRLRDAGCTLRVLTHPDQRVLRFGASDTARIAQLYAATEDAEVDIVMALRGGYGISRLLASLDGARLAASGKLFVGHSDFTALHMLLLRHGAASFAGPMLCDDFTRADLSAFTLDDFWRCLQGPQHSVTWQAAGNPSLQCEGQLWGGNLTMLTHLIGSPWLVPPEQGILFVEDISEHPFRVERMLLQLDHAGILARQSALVLGDFSGYRLGAIDQGYDLDAMVEFIRARCRIPVLTGLPFGHMRDKHTLAVGSMVTLISDEEGVRLTMRDYPNLTDRIG